MIDQYCIMCHSEALKTAGVVLEGVPVSHVGDNTELWERVLRKFGTGQMPPPGMPRPDTATSAQFTSWRIPAKRERRGSPEPGRSGDP
jgi:hypothetical protein